MKPLITVIRCHNTTHQNEQCNAFIAGLKKLGIPYAYNTSATSPVKTQIVALWGWKWGKYWRERGKDVIVIEHGYIGDRRKYTSLALNGLNGYGTFFDYPDDGGERFKAHGGFIKPWKTGNENKPPLILGQMPKDQSLRDIDIKEVYNRWVRVLNKPVLFRQHPEAVKRGVYIDVENAQYSNCTLEEAFDSCSYAIAFNSNSLLDALLNGVPAVAMDEGTLVYDLCGKGLNHVIKPDREKTIHSIAWKQFTLEEIGEGWAIENLLSLVQVNR